MSLNDENVQGKLTLLLIMHSFKNMILKHHSKPIAGGIEAVAIAETKYLLYKKVLGILRFQRIILT